MSATPAWAAPSRRFRRILMALDSASEDLAAVDSVAALAARLQAELMGLYVEDVDLARLAEHRDLSAISTFSARPHAASDALRQALRLQVARSRRALESAAARLRITARFEVRQGRLTPEVLDAAAGDADLLVVGWTGGGHAAPSFAARRSPAATARAVAEVAGRSVLLLRPGVRLGGPVLVAYDGTPAAEQALAAAIEIADRDRGALEVAVISRRIDEADAFRRAVAETVREAGLPARIVEMPKATLDDLCRAAERDHAGLLVVAAEQALIRGEAVRGLLERIGCSVLLIR